MTYTASPITPVYIGDAAINSDVINNNFRMFSTAINTTTANVKQLSDYGEYYIDDKIKQSEERMANKIYNIISEIIEINMTKDEFVKMLLSDETSDA
jgi:hypothetical protein